MRKEIAQDQEGVNCRIGSLESSDHDSASTDCVNCRIGSLEITGPRTVHEEIVNCRIGSLEIKVIDENLAESR